MGYTTQSLKGNTRFKSPSGIYRHFTLTMLYIYFFFMNIFPPPITASQRHINEENGVGLILGQVIPGPIKMAPTCLPCLALTVQGWIWGVRLASGSRVHFHALGNKFRWLIFTLASEVPRGSCPPFAMSQRPRMPFARFAAIHSARCELQPLQTLDMLRVCFALLRFTGLYFFFYLWVINHVGLLHHVTLR